MTIVNIIKPKDLGKFEKKFPEELAAMNRKALHEMGWVAKKLLQDLSVNVHWRGIFRYGWIFVTTPTTLRIWNREDHAIFVEMGRKPNKRPPPAGAILPWVKDHFVNADIGLARKIARNIGIRGIKARPVMTSPDFAKAIEIALSKKLNTAWEAAAKKAGLWG